MVRRDQNNLVSSIVKQQDEISSFSVILSELPLLKSLFFDRREYQNTFAVDCLLLQNTVGTENVTPSIKHCVALIP